MPSAITVVRVPADRAATTPPSPDHAVAGGSGRTKENPS